MTISGGSLSASSYIYYPPDTNGAVGSGYAVELLNGYYGVYSATGGNAGTRLTTSTLNNFWTSAGVTPNGSAYDPRLVFDPFTNHWFASSLDGVSDVGAPTTPNSFLLAVSKDSNPLDGWTGFAIASDGSGSSGGGGGGSWSGTVVNGTGGWGGTTVNGTGGWGGTVVNGTGGWGGTVSPSFPIAPSISSGGSSTAPNSPAASSSSQYWADFDTLGFNAKAVYLSGNMYTIGSTPVLNSVDLVAVPKASLTAVSPSLTGYSIQTDQSPANYGYAVQPANDLSGSNSNAGYLASGYYYQGVQQGSVQYANGAFTFSSGAYTKFATGVGTINPAPQLGTNSTPIATGDLRLSSSLVYSNGLIWGVQTIQNPNFSPTTAPTALRVFAIKPGSTTPTVEKIVTDPNNPGSWLYYGSLAINSNGQLVLSFNESSSTQYVSIYALAGVFNGTSLAVGTPVLLKASTVAYSIVDPTDKLNRWGDYSTTVVDPGNAGNFWTFQEYADGAASWSTAIYQLTLGSGTQNAALISPGDVPENTTLPLLALGAAPLLLLRRRRQT